MLQRGPAHYPEEEEEELVYIGRYVILQIIILIVFSIRHKNKPLKNYI
jgi:hypothetical protein